jgi:phosphotransferase system  glucose/maltose/N-acetylglucosamine-specific IIC component
MTSLSLVMRVGANMVLFVLYLLITHVLVGFATGGFIKYVLGYPVPHDGSAIMDIIAIITVLLVFVITLAWRRYFYLCLDKRPEKWGE